jgi:hypothetical protein
MSALDQLEYDKNRPSTLLNFIGKVTGDFGLFDYTDERGPGVD